MPAVNPLHRWTFTINLSNEAIEASVLITLLNVRYPGANWVFQTERGARAGRLHWQGRIKLIERKRKLTLLNEFSAGLADHGITREDISFFVEADAASSFQYAMKPDTRVKGPWSDKPLYLGADLNVIHDAPYPWQREFRSHLMGPADDRTIFWFRNPDGCVGKSLFVKYMCFRYKCWKLAIGKSHQLRSVVAEVVEQKGGMDAWLIDLPRKLGSEDSVADLVCAAEDIKNGHVSCAMYGKAKQVFMKTSHVVFFTNYDCPREFASADRWKVCTVDPADLTLYIDGMPVGIGPDAEAELLDLDPSDFREPAPVGAGGAGGPGMGIPPPIGVRDQLVIVEDSDGQDSDAETVEYRDSDGRSHVSDSDMSDSGE